MRWRVSVWVGEREKQAYREESVYVCVHMLVRVSPYAGVRACTHILYALPARPPALLRAYVHAFVRVQPRSSVVM